MGFKRLIVKTIDKMNWLTRAQGAAILWVGLIITGVVLSYGVQLIYHFLYNINISIGAFTFSIAWAFIIFLMGLVHIYTIIFKEHQRRIEKLIANQTGKSIIEVLNIEEATSLMGIKAQNCKLIKNTRFFHHNSKKGKSTRFDKNYNDLYDVWRDHIKSAVKKKDVEVEEISSLNFRKDVEDNWLSFKNYKGKKIDCEQTNWMNFTVIEPLESDLPKQLFFGYGVNLKGNSLMCYYTEDQRIVEDFLRRFEDIKEMAFFYD